MKSVDELTVDRIMNGDDEELLGEEFLIIDDGGDGEPDFDFDDF